MFAATILLIILAAEYDFCEELRRLGRFIIQRNLPCDCLAAFLCECNNGFHYFDHIHRCADHMQLTTFDIHHQKYKLASKSFVQYLGRKIVVHHVVDKATAEDLFR